MISVAPIGVNSSSASFFSQTSTSRWETLTALTTASPDRNSASASAAKEVSPSMTRPASSTKTARSASPSWAIPTSASVVATSRERSVRFAGTGSESRPGKWPSGVALTVRTVQPSSRKNRGEGREAAPWPGSTATVRSASAIAARSTLSSSCAR